MLLHQLLKLIIRVLLAMVVSLDELGKIKFVFQLWHARQCINHSPLCDKLSIFGVDVHKDIHDMVFMVSYKLLSFTATAQE